MHIQIIEQFAANETSTVLNRGEMFGDGFFSTGLIEAGKILHAGQHIQRLFDSAQRLHFPPIDRAALSAQLDNSVKHYHQATFRISLGRVQKSRGYAIAKDQSYQICLFVFPWVTEPEGYCRTLFAKTPISVNPLLAGIKHANRLDNVLAASEINEGIDEVLMCHDNRVICGSRSNLFIYENEKWLTPKLDRCGVKGLTRSRLIAAAESLNIKIVECDISRQQVQQAEAAFITNSLIGLWPISYIEDRVLDSHISCQLKSQLEFKR